MANTLEIIKQRSSTRGYTEEALTQAEVDAIVQAGLQAPTATNRQEIHFTVIDGKNPILDEIDAEKNRLRGIQPGATNSYYGAPIVIFLSSEEAFGWGALDAGIAVENMALAAEALGLGNIIVGCINDAMHGEKEQYFKEALKIPATHGFRIALGVGHKAVTKEPHTYDVAAQVTVL